MVEADIKDLGFILIKEYTHDQFKTRRYKKGYLIVEFTYEGNKIHVIDLTIEEVFIQVNYDQVKMLDKIINRKG